MLTCLARALEAREPLCLEGATWRTGLSSCPQTAMWAVSPAGPSLQIILQRGQTRPGGW